MDNTFKDRLVVERDQLSNKLERLRDAMAKESFMRIEMHQRNQMINQEYHMTKYLECLDNRLELLNKNE